MVYHFDMPLALEKQDEDKYYTCADLYELDESVRAEIINGVIYMMSPPSVTHQRLLMRLSRDFANFLDGKTCEVFPAPFGVRLFPGDDLTDNTLVEPDIVVICDPSKIDERGCNGPPDLIVEIVSPSNSRRDRLLKFNLYLKAKVREYWVVHGDSKEIEVHLLDNDRYFTRMYGVNEPDTKEEEKVEEIIPVTVLDGLEINTKNIFG